MGIIDILLLVVILSWLGGYSLHFGGDLIHLLLIVALILLIVRLARRV
mgnify:CR=1 FL=1